eukprot:CAMPEP_0113685274 /NCGR_PEP_ID=MMETSP0038_2-20120614/14560_1 /TAXON_ID=2898 /ORGANISM="Cryptomonas paramecium" /LENGTH=721 /DNA_ID=CAMNT_0000605301 /DNA_START=20 /DNA_END=2182 /DNA_ORIENTATION=+ /assembly_acc=CAM_ASM_000170
MARAKSRLCMGLWYVAMASQIHANNLRPPAHLKWPVYESQVHASLYLRGGLGLGPDETNPGKVFDPLSDTEGVRKQCPILAKQSEYDADHELSMIGADLAFKTDFMDPNNVLPMLVKYVVKGRCGWQAGILFSPLGSIVQSSMTGKSRLLLQLSKANLYVFYINLLPSTSFGYPQSFRCVRDYLTDSNLSVARCVAFIIECLKRLNEYEGSREEWIKVQDEAFWKGVVDSAINTEQTWRIMKRDSQELLAEEFNRACTRPATLFVFDEAGALFDDEYAADTLDYAGHPAAARFIRLRQAFSLAPGSVHAPFALVADTALRACSLDPSLASFERACQKSLLPPFYLVANADILLDRRPASMRQLADWKYYFNFGRPFWGALVATGRADYREISDVVVTKILGGSMKTRHLWPKTFVESLAIVGIRACIDVCPRSGAARILVARHMRSVLHISEDCESVQTGYCSEPALVEGAALLLNDVLDSSLAGDRERQVTSATEYVHKLWGLRADKWGHLVAALKDGLHLGQVGLHKGQVEAGVRGELVARLLLLMAWDVACLRSMLPTERTVSSGVFLRPVPAIVFLSSLLSLDAEEWARVQGALSLDGIGAWVRCTHFIKAVDYVPDREQLVHLFQRGAALITKDCQPGVDLMIPMYFCSEAEFDDPLQPERISAILVQCKNIRGATRKSDTDSATSMPTPRGLRIRDDDEAARLPFVSLHMSLAAE